MFISGYVRMALQSGMLYTTSEKQVGFIAFRRPGEKAGLRAGLCFVKPTLRAMRLRDRIRFAKVMAKGGGTNFVRKYTLASGGPYCDCGYHKK